jgi:hypothetical protein
MNKDVVYEVVKKLLGPIDPIGDTNIDNERFVNLEATIDLVNSLLFDINRVATCATCDENSMKEAGLKAKLFFAAIKSKELYGFN